MHVDSTIQLLEQIQKDIDRTRNQYDYANWNVFYLGKAISFIELAKEYLEKVK